ncbi:MAG TPA: M20 aminoacylase family protein [Thauera sp.]|uniref:M20 aminoacylase family protein n=1 Tax=Thauera sp. TaxID=1905334 RepID=UPI002C0DC078|nr:M20 aminoacylase family protein [Thauera sp.]HRP25642.1 M20 aminoacylase family protein [Thauera sp.]HRP66170.1 M20 aminoacylase family protein [Thauera sp.]
MSDTTLFAPDVDAMKTWRHAIHQHPELGFEEHDTSALVASQLQAWGYEVHTGIAVTGVVGVLRIGDGSGPRLGLRADMDALPIQEMTGLPWASKVPGKMHGCGHDGHTAMLLGAAQALAERARQGQLPGNGTLVLIFQPAEELGGGGGARRMLEERLFERFPCDAIFGMHNMPGIPVGQVHVRPGAFMASSDKVLIRFIGLGGHGGLPHKAVDPTLPAAATVLALQSIVGRNINPNLAAVISVGRIQAGSAYNIIAESAEIELSVRALDPAVRDVVEQRIRELAEHQARAYGCTSEIRYERGYPVLINAAAPTAFAVEVARKVFGDAQVVADAQPLTGSEDFAFLLEQVPGCYVLVGNGDNGHADGQWAGGCMVHNPHYDFNDACLAVGARLWVGLAEQYFEIGA